MSIFKYKCVYIYSTNRYPLTTQQPIWQLQLPLLPWAIFPESRNRSLKSHLNAFLNGFVN